MVARSDHRIVVGDQHFLVADDRADGGAWRQGDVFDHPADHFAGFAVAVGNRLDGLGGAAAQGVNADDVATAHVGQQGADGGQLRADGDVDLPALHQVDVGRVVDQGHHLARAQALGQQRGHDVGFIVVGQG